MDCLPGIDGDVGAMAMCRAGDREPLDVVLARARDGGRFMARMDLAGGETDPRMILWSIERDCREVGADWGLSPAAEEAVVQMYLEGARDVLAGRCVTRWRPEAAAIPPEVPRRGPLEACREDLLRLRAWASEAEARARRSGSLARQVADRSREAAARSWSLLDAGASPCGG